MTQTNGQGFQAAVVAEKFKTACVKFEQLLFQCKNAVAIRKKLHEDLRAYQENGILTVAFVGQYNAGKSTTISALTGQRDIRIDADIATDQTASYDWNSIKVIDTPGLFTDRSDHDEITYAAIAKADLLVFSLTYMLFDSTTVENFKKLAYEKGYRWKMMLLVNKMSAGAGEEEQKIANYRESLADALQPYSLKEFPVCFIDAKDHCEGVDEDDDFLVEISRFQTFVDELNQFVQRRASLARFDTPVRIALSCVDEAQTAFTRDSSGDSAFLELLTRLSRIVLREHDRLRTKVKSMTLKMSSAIAKEGSALAAEMGNNADFEQLVRQAEVNLRKHYEQVGDEMQVEIEAAVASIQIEVERVFQSDLTQAFVTRLNLNQTVSAQTVNAGNDSQRLKGQIDWLQQIGGEVGARLGKSATKDFATAGTGFLRSMNVAGSGLHKTVYAVGKFVGFKFQPWQAVGMAKGIGNAALLLGPALALFSVGAEIYSTHQEQEHEKAMANARREITSQFQKIAQDLELQIEAQLREFEAQAYGEVERKIGAARQQEETAIAVSNPGVRKLIEIRQEFESILTTIRQVITVAA